LVLLWGFIEYEAKVRAQAVTDTGFTMAQDRREGRVFMYTALLGRV